jgi:hypothetical protein
MNYSNSIRSAFLVIGLIVAATTASHAQQQRFAPTTQSPQHAKLGIQTKFQQVGIKNGIVANFGERVSNVRPGSPAAQTGLEAGDTIVGYYQGNSYRKISRQNDLEFAISDARGNLRIRVINYRNGQYVDATIHFNPAAGQGGYGNNTSGPVVVDHRYPKTAPPAPQYLIPVARPGYVWIRGHYVWRNGAYAWTRGHWESAKAGNASWIPGQWSKHGNCWKWTPGYWTKTGPTVTVTRR